MLGDQGDRPLEELLMIALMDPAARAGRGGRAKGGRSGASGEGHSAFGFDLSRRLADDNHPRRPRERYDRHDTLVESASTARGELGAVDCEFMGAIHAALSQWAKINP